MTILFLAFAACSIDSQQFDPSMIVTNRTIEAEEAPAEAEYTDMDEAAPAEVSEVAPTLTVQIKDGSAGFVELRPWGTRTDGTMWVGEALSTTMIADGHVELQLPPAAPRQERLGEPAVAYAIALRADDGGEPGIYTGLATAELVYVRQEAAFEGSTTGWNLVDGWETDAPAWGAVSDGVELMASLQGSAELDIGGRTWFDVPFGTHVTLATESLDGMSQAYDSPIGPEWSLFIGGAPRSEVLVTGEDYQGARFELFAYQDDGDNQWSGEAVEGRACAGPSDAVVTWFAAPHDLQRALKLRTLGVRAGWDVLLSTDLGEMQLPQDQLKTLVLAEDCG